MTPLQEIVEISRRYGEGTDWVIAGGGNTSIKDGETMWIKASGTTLAGIDESRFVSMDRRALNALWEKSYPADPDRREEQALADLMACRTDREATVRPSVETLMHALFPHRIVCHTHPTVINGVTCANAGEAETERLFGTFAVWIPTVNPGYTLAMEIRDRVRAWQASHEGAWPTALVMQNHGLVVAGETPQAVHDVNRRMYETVAAAIRSEAHLSPEERDTPRLRRLGEAVVAAYQEVESMYGTASASPTAAAFFNPELERRSASREDFAPIATSPTPDHIVYAGHRPCFVSSPEVASSPSVLARAVIAEIGRFRSREGALPKVVVVQGLGAVAIAATAKKSAVARLLFLDALKIACYAESFGGVKVMPEDQIDFIRNWEVERFRERQTST